MDELLGKVTEVLQDPNQMQQIMEMASAMGLSTAINSGDSKYQTLCRALLPYLNPRRRARLERAMELSNLSRLAETALTGQLTSLGAGKEEESLV